MAHRSPALLNRTERSMKKLLITAAVLAFMGGPVLAQGSTGPAAQGDNMNKPGMNNPTGTSDSMGRRPTNEGTTGMNSEVPRSGVRPDASGQGGSGPGSDQGGTKTAPKR